MARVFSPRSQEAGAVRAVGAIYSETLAQKGTGEGKPHRNGFKRDWKSHLGYSIASKVELESNKTLRCNFCSRKTVVRNK